MITKIDKNYTIAYSKGGVRQFADFNYSEGILKTHSFRPNWVKSEEIPSLEGLNEIEDILKVIKDWSYCQQAKIILINGNLPNYNSGERIKKCAEDFEIFFNKLCLSFFQSEILPILRRNKWKISCSWAGYTILIKKNKKDWVNVDTYHEDSMLIDNICNNFLKKVINSKVQFRPKYEHGYVSGDNLSEFTYWLPQDKLKEMKIYIEL
jgi:hypothetical protein